MNRSMARDLVTFIKERRKLLKMTQRELAERAGVGLRFIRDLEQGKQTLRLDKVNQVLALFGHKMAPMKSKPEVGYEIPTICTPYELMGE